MSNEEVEEEFGKSIYKSEVLAFIQNRSYVDFVTEFSMVRILGEQDNYSLFDTARSEENIEEIKASYPWSLLVSADHHDITIIGDPTYEIAKPRGIANMVLGTDFIITE